MSNVGGALDILTWLQNEILPQRLPGRLKLQLPEKISEYGRDEYLRGMKRIQEMVQVEILDAIDAAIEEFKGKK